MLVETTLRGISVRFFSLSTNITITHIIPNGPFSIKSNCNAAITNAMISQDD